MIKVWGRHDGSNVIKAMWCIGELGIEYDRVDWGGKFGGNDDPAYRAMNPNGRLPTIEEEDGMDGMGIRGCHPLSLRQARHGRSLSI